MFKKKNKKETAAELKAKLAELEGEPTGEPEPEQEVEGEDLLPPPIDQPEKPKKEKKVGEATLEVKPFTLNDADMGLAIEAMMGRPELKVYNDWVIGQEFSRIIQGYNKEVKEQLPDEEQSQE